MMKLKFWKYPKNGQIYILPTWYGFWYGVMTFLSLLIAFYYQNNFAFVIVFLFISFGMISLVQTHFHLKAFKVRIHAIESNHVGEPILFSSSIEEGKFPQTLTFSLYGKDSVSFKSNGMTTIKQVYSDRGKKYIDRFKTSTDFPFGLFRAWRWTYVTHEFYVYPEKANEGIAFFEVFEEGEGRRGELGIEDISSLDHWKKGDSYRHILWRKHSPFTPWQVKKFHGGATVIIKLNFNEEEMYYEEYISRCCRALYDCYHIPGRELRVYWGENEYKIDEKNYYKVMEKLAEINC